MSHTLPELPYSYDALEPFFDARTMEIHHTKHHQTYVDKLNAALDGQTELQGKTAGDLLKDLNAIPENIRTAARNHGGGHANHSFWWPMLKKDVAFKGPVAEAVDGIENIVRLQSEVCERRVVGGPLGSNGRVVIGVGVVVLVVEAALDRFF